MKVIPIKSEETYEWCLKKHYAHRIPQIVHAFGLYDDNNILSGICTFGIPASPFLCMGICGKEHETIVLELNRLCINEGMPKNTASFFISQCFKLLPQNRILVSYADSGQNHNGYIYQATNWIYTGLSAKRTEVYDMDNINRHSKSVCESKNENTNLGVRDRSRKHRYIFFLGNRWFKKDMIKKLKYKQEPYPKGDNKRYDASYNPQVQQLLF
jgi:hypothetical protein